MSVLSARIDGGGQTGWRLNTKGWPSGALPTRGDVMTVEGVYSLNPITLVPTDHLQQFVVTGLRPHIERPVISIAPRLLVKGRRRTVSSTPTDGAAITLWTLATEPAYLETPE